MSGFWGVSEQHLAFRVGWRQRGGEPDRGHDHSGGYSGLISYRQARIRLLAFSSA